METKNPLLYQDWFDLNFLGNFVNKDNKQVRFINEKRFPLKPEIISSRVMTNWIEQGVVDDPRDKKTGKHWFSVSELVWMGFLINKQILNIIKVINFLFGD